MSGDCITCPHCAQEVHIPRELSNQIKVCPYCRESLQNAGEAQPLGPPEKRETKECPFCGEDILVKARKCKHCGEFLDKYARAVSGVNEPEKKLWQGHPSAWNYTFSWLLGAILIGLGFVLMFYIEYTYTLSLVGGIVMIHAALHWQTRVFTITNHRVVAKVGIISRSVQEITIHDIKSVGMTQNMLQRILNLGAIQVGSAGTAGIEVEFSGIAEPVKIRDKIRAVKDEVNGA